MKKYFIILPLFLFFLSCDEIPPEIPGPPEDGERVVLMEEFSGGSCVPCSDAALIVEEQVAIHGKNLIVVTMHTLSLGQTAPAFGAEYDFRTQNGQDVIEDLGLPQGIPSGVINRKLFEGETSLQLRRDKWTGNISNELSQGLKINLNLEIDFDEISRELSLEVTAVPTENLAGDVRVFALITESGIIDKQATPNGIVDEWEHNHILRDYISSLNGESLGSNLSTGIPVSKSFNFTVPAEDGLWVAENLEVVCFVAEITNDSREVLQAASDHILE